MLFALGLAAFLGYRERERVDHALELYERGYGKRLFFTGRPGGPLPKPLTHRWHEYVLSRGVPLEALVLFPTRAASTYKEAGELRALVAEDSGIGSVIVVSGPYHLRRA